MASNKFISHVKEPLVRVVRRDNLPMWKAWLYRLIAIVLALGLVDVFVFSITGLDPVGVMTVMWEGTFGNIVCTSASIALIMKLLLISVALAPAFKMKFWNIGAEGQVLAGALATAVIMVTFSNLPNSVLIPFMVVSAILAGGIWGLIPALFKAKWGVNETLFTLMMNYVAMSLVDFFVNQNKGDRASIGTLNVDTEKGWLPKLGMEINWTVVIVVLIITVLMFIYLKYTKQGYEIAVVGESINTAKYAGISVKKTIIRTMVISGVICGICGFLSVAGEDQTISRNTAGGYGFTAIIVAWLAKFNTLFMILISAFIIFLEQGTKAISDEYVSVGFNESACKMVVGLVLFFVIACEFFINYSLAFRRTRKEK
ncbi:MAG TPA: ABC transporter permease [Eubacterium sp.]|nr:ABC transporter permease [Eubacterium sp.]